MFPALLPDGQDPGNAQGASRGWKLSQKLSHGHPHVDVERRSTPLRSRPQLLAWILNRAIRNDNPFVPWAAANEYQREMGLPEGGRSNKELQARCVRIAGLGIAIERSGNGVTCTRGYKVLVDSTLPKSITGSTIDAHQRPLPGLEDRLASS